jgi:hypothetical protein
MPSGNDRARRAVRFCLSEYWLEYAPGAGRPGDEVYVRKDSWHWFAYLLSMISDFGGIA